MAGRQDTRQLSDWLDEIPHCLQQITTVARKSIPVVNPCGGTQLAETLHRLAAFGHGGTSGDVFEEKHLAAIHKLWISFLAHRITGLCFQ